MKLSVIMLSDAIYSIVALNVIMLSVIILNVVFLSAVAPNELKMPYNTFSVAPSIFNGNVKNVISH